MSPVETIIRFAHAAPARRALLIEAAWNLAGARAAIVWLPFRRAVRIGAVPLARAAKGEVGALVDAIEVVAARVPWLSVCFDRGLALQRALRRRGHDARLHYGLSAPGSDAFDAHVWVELEGRILIGAEEAVGRHPVAVFPAD